MNIDLKIPEHIAIIMDGNGRWAKERGLPRTDGHIEGQKALEATLKAAAEFGIKYLTVYAFSTENWNRPQEEVDTLMSLLVQAMASKTAELIEQGVRLTFIGDLKRLPENVRAKLDETIEKTKQGTRITLCIALSYSGRDEILRATNLAISKALNGEAKELTESDFDSLLDTQALPELDLMIRTGKEQRISNFLLWQVAYAELFFSNVYWPDFGKEALLEALIAYTERERRYGKTSEQILLTED